MLDVLIVTWDRRQVSAVQAAGFGESARLSGCWSAEWPEAVPTPLQNPQAAGLWLAEQWRSAGLTAKPVWLVVPREDVILRHLELPQVTDAELPDLVRFQAAARSAVPIEQLVLDFLPLSPHPARVVRDVLSATLPKASLTAWTAAIKATEHELVGVSVSSVALADWGVHVDKHHPHTNGGATLVVGWEAPRLELAIIAGNELVFAHAARIGTDADVDQTNVILSEISRAVIAGQRLRPDLTIGQSWLVGAQSTLAAEVAERLNCPAELIEPTVVSSHRDALRKVDGHPLEAALLLGGVWGRTSPAVPALNFLRPRQPPPKSDPRKQLLAIGGGIALLVGFLLVGGTLMWASSLDRQINDLLVRQSDLNSLVAAGQTPLAAATTAQDWVRRGVPQLTQITELESTMPGGLERPYLSEYNFNVANSGDALATLYAQGSAKTRSDVETLKQSLVDQRRYRVKPSEVTAGRDPKYPQSFTLDLELVPAKAESPATPEPPAKPGA
jgi:hypothetical protein